jgi:hypothetical protein
MNLWVVFLWISRELEFKPREIFSGYSQRKYFCMKIVTRHINFLFRQFLDNTRMANINDTIESNEPEFLSINIIKLTDNGIDYSFIMCMGRDVFRECAYWFWLQYCWWQRSTTIYPCKNFFFRERHKDKAFCFLGLQRDFCFSNKKEWSGGCRWTSKSWR